MNIIVFLLAVWRIYGCIKIIVTPHETRQKQYKDGMDKIKAQPAQIRNTLLKILYATAYIISIVFFSMAYFTLQTLGLAWLGVSFVLLALNLYDDWMIIEHGESAIRKFDFTSVLTVLYAMFTIIQLVMVGL